MPTLSLDDATSTAQHLHVRMEKDAPPHDGSCGHPPSSPLGPVILELVSLVNYLFGNDLLDDICTNVHPSSQELFVNIPVTTYLPGL